MPDPFCSIRPDQCPELSTAFQSGFANWSATFNKYDEWDVCYENSGCLHGNIDKWMECRKYEEGFLASCPGLLESACLRQEMSEVFKEASAHTIGGISTLMTLLSDIQTKRTCTVNAHKFVLIHFPVPSPQSRDICASGFFGETWIAPTSDESTLVFATLDLTSYWSGCDSLALRASNWRCNH